MIQAKTKSKTMAAVQIGLAVFSIGTVAATVYFGVTNMGVGNKVSVNSNRIASVDLCEGNFDCDTDVDGSDAAVFRKDMGRGPGNNNCTNANPCKGDLNCDEKVDSADEAIFRQDFGRSNFKNPCPKCNKFNLCQYKENNGNGQANNPHCRADYNLDQVVDSSDKNIFEMGITRDTKKDPCTNANPCKADLNCNGKINNEDSNIFDGALKERSLKKSCPELNAYKDCEYKK